MPVYSHSRKVESGGYEGTKPLVDHLAGVTRHAVNNFHAGVTLGERKVLLEVLETTAWLHDLGKYTKFFQEYLLATNQPPRHLRAHSMFGAHAALELLQHRPDYALIAYFLIKSHHRNLQNLEDAIFPEGSDRPQEDAFRLQSEALLDIAPLQSLFQKAINLQFQYFSAKSRFLQFKQHLKSELNIRWYFITNYLFSLLIEADKLDASNTPAYSRVPIPQDQVDKRLGAPRYRPVRMSAMSQNELRNYLRAQVVENINMPDILDVSIFTLTAPTGIGKTLTALDFALKLRDKISTVENHVPQIIYALPFINIIEQALTEYEKTLNNGRIIAHYQLADIFRAERKEDDVDSSHDYHRQLMTWDTWQGDIVITTFVQLFHTLIGHRNRLLKKFHHLAGAIIIIDEIQTIDISKLPLIGAALNYLARYMNTRIVIMTATQPRLFDLMTTHLNIPEPERVKVHRLLDNEQDLFECFNRTRIVPMVDQRITSEQFFDKFIRTWTPGKNCLIVVNTVARSIDLFNLLLPFCKGQHANLYYLSTNITPVERKARIDKIRNNLKKGNCILISTQVVEAGVDLDFDLGFRDLAPIPSIIQVAGRINRENSSDRINAPLYVVDFGECTKIYGHATEVQARTALKTKKVFSEPEYRNLVDEYFDRIAQKQMTDFSDAEKIFRAMCSLDYDRTISDGRNKSVSDFKLIEDDKGISIYVELPDDPDATTAREAYQEMVIGNLSKSAFDEKYKRMLNARVIAVPKTSPAVSALRSEAHLSEYLLWIRPEMAEEYYNASTGFIRHKEEAPSIVSF